MAPLAKRPASTSAQPEIAQHIRGPLDHLASVFEELLLEVDESPDIRFTANLQSLHAGIFLLILALGVDQAPFLRQGLRPSFRNPEIDRRDDIKCALRLLDMLRFLVYQDIDAEAAENHVLGEVEADMTHRQEGAEGKSLRNAEPQKGQDDGHEQEDRKKCEDQMVSKISDKDESVRRTSDNDEDVTDGSHKTDPRGRGAAESNIKPEAVDEAKRNRDLHNLALKQPWWVYPWGRTPPAAPPNDYDAGRPRYADRTPSAADRDNSLSGDKGTENRDTVVTGPADEVSRNRALHNRPLKIPWWICPRGRNPPLGPPCDPFPRPKRFTNRHSAAANRDNFFPAVVGVDNTGAATVDNANLDPAVANDNNPEPAVLENNNQDVAPPGNNNQQIADPGDQPEEDDDFLVEVEPIVAQHTPLVTAYDSPSIWEEDEVDTDKPPRKRRRL